jgi:fatty acid amide hydrolase 2
VNVWVEALKSIFGQSEHSWAALQAGIVDELPTFFNSNQDFVVSKREQLKREINELLGDEGILLFPSFPRSYYYHNEALLTPFDFVYTGLWNGKAVKFHE